MSAPRQTVGSLALLLAVSAASTDCSSSPGSPQPSLLAPIPGFVQTLTTTKCGLGSGVHVVHLPGDTQWVGSEGFFDVDLANQSAYCFTNPFRPLKGPSAPTEIAEVSQYFVGAGLPASQIGPISTSYSFDSSGEQYVNAKIERVVDGVPVPESSAWAGLVDGQSLGEGVYWPELPASVSRELMELEAIVTNPARLAAFQAMLPAGLVTGSIVIHHRDASQRVPGHPADEVPIEAHACYDALIAGNGDLGLTECYLPDGSMFTFPSF